MRAEGGGDIPADGVVPCSSEEAAERGNIEGVESPDGWVVKVSRNRGFGEDCALL